MTKNNKQITLYQGDCLEIMNDLIAKGVKVDCIITDPPYKLNHTTGGTTSIGLNHKWQGNIKAGNTVMGFDSSVQFSDWLPLAFNILKDNSHCYIFCNDKNVQELLNEAEKVGFRESNILVWIKNNSTPNRYYMKNIEFVLFLYKGKAKPINNMGSKCAVQIKNIVGCKKFHPTQKPLELIEIYINNSSLENELVLDPFMGSGTTGVACQKLNRNFIGIELLEKYFKIAEKRINEVSND